MRLAVVGSPEDVRGFGLAGVQGRSATTRKEAILVLRELLTQRGEIGLVLVSAALARVIAREVAELRRRGVPPAVLVLPDREEPLS